MNFSNCKDEQYETINHQLHEGEKRINQINELTQEDHSSIVITMNNLQLCDTPGNRYYNSRNSKKSKTGVIKVQDEQINVQNRLKLNFSNVKEECFRSIETNRNPRDFEGHYPEFFSSGSQPHLHKVSSKLLGEIFTNYELCFDNLDVLEKLEEAKEEKEDTERFNQKTLSSKSKYNDNQDMPEIRTLEDIRNNICSPEEIRLSTLSRNYVSSFIIPSPSTLNKNAIKQTVKRAFSSKNSKDSKNSRDSIKHSRNSSSSSINNINLAEIKRNELRKTSKGSNNSVNKIHSLNIPKLWNSKDAHILNSEYEEPQRGIQTYDNNYNSNKNPEFIFSTNQNNTLSNTYMNTNSDIIFRTGNSVRPPASNKLSKISLDRYNHVFGDVNSSKKVLGNISKSGQNSQRSGHNKKNSMELDGDITNYKKHCGSNNNSFLDTSNQFIRQGSNNSILQDLKDRKKTYDDVLNYPTHKHNK
jgi:hypothetical protein